MPYGGSVRISRGRSGRLRRNSVASDLTTEVVEETTLFLRNLRALVAHCDLWCIGSPFVKVISHAGRSRLNERHKSSRLSRKSYSVFSYRQLAYPVESTQANFKVSSAVQSGFLCLQFESHPCDSINLIMQFITRQRKRILENKFLLASGSGMSVRIHR